jgi:hypothetical protein
MPKNGDMGQFAKPLPCYFCGNSTRVGIISKVGKIKFADFEVTPICRDCFSKLFLSKKLKFGNCPSCKAPIEQRDVKNILAIFKYFHKDKELCWSCAVTKYYAKDNQKRKILKNDGKK